jgi:tetratricopeptide (TPR) repeat protein
MLLTTGCPLGVDSRTEPPQAVNVGGVPVLASTLPWWKQLDAQPVKTLAVNPGDAEEVAAVGAYLGATVKYRYALTALQDYYAKIGHQDKKLWTDRELKNLREAQTFTFTGVSAPPPPTPQSIEGVAEAVLVEGVLAARRAWLSDVAKLGELYGQIKQPLKAALVVNVQERFDPIRAYDYFITAEVPPATLRPTTPSLQANALFEKAYKLHRQGKPLPALADYRKERRALLLFRQLVDEYPASTKIALSAYYIGEIYKEYFNEDVRAVRWYERAWQWDPNITEPARFQAATVYDLRLSQRGEALKLYREVIKHEQFNGSNVWFATRRIEELTQPRQ